jgi:hypothetical protein
MESLAQLADKYIIEHLHQDICVTHLIDLADGQTFTSSLVITKHPPSVDLWLFAAHYGFSDLETYCLENKPIYEELLKRLADSEQGIVRFSKIGVPVSKLNLLVRRVATAALERSCYFCLAPGSGSPSPRTPSGTSAVSLNGPVAQM